MRLGWKLLMVLATTLAILLPLAMIRDLIHDRQAHRAQAVDSIARSYAGAQAFTGPVLVVPYVETVEVEDRDAQGVAHKRLREREGHWTFFPERLEIAGDLKPSTRRLGLHEVRVYEWQARAAARFDAAIPAADPARPRRIGRPWLDYGLADVRGILGTPRLRVDGAELALAPGLGAGGGGGVHARLPVPQAGTRLAFDSRLDFVLGGTESLALVPLGKRNRFALASTWPHPRFDGSFLPRTRTIDDHGFRAEWEVSSLATAARAQYAAGRTMPRPLAGPSRDGRAPPAAAADAIDAVGIALVDPVDVYTQTDRASKYGILFVLLTFVGFCMLELLERLPIHPIQYGLVGLALAIFFLLLLGLSEHIAFGRAYLAAGSACIGLLWFYLAPVLRSRARAAGFAALLATLYAALYGLLVSEDNALVLGAGLLFLILAAIMVVTRRVDWYQPAARLPSQG
ncbi:cell envelope integrity protein CreD [Cognatiluteimonas weifangensis]|uniref:Cell envelope integrity protein CreD n=1 Tax=Cognatiluteimonas weifangensis TaxID=2303539 RepID=A0A372DK21_9GAMM|nr:cell envelope integrity protein CreD [Luteimonas weifangensis]RFP59925.1 cell envelope integrity protein CreD [Luteimonas weifangensis]